MISHGNTQKHTEKIYFEDLTYQIRGAVFEVYRQLGHGFLEAVYQNALLIELQQIGLKVRSEVPLPVFYKGQKIAEYRADIIVENTVILELKAQRIIPTNAEAQVLNYLKATGIKVGLLINFHSPGATVKRFVM